jgi:hypothetical protein
MSSYGLSEQAVDEPKPGVKQLQIQIRDGVVEEVRFCGERLEQLTIVAPADQGLIEDCSGQIGLYNFKSTASFSDFSFNGQEFLFRKGGD